MGPAKIAIISDGEHTALYANGFLYGSGIERLEFSTEDCSGCQRATIRLLEVNAAAFKPENTPKFVEKLLREMEN